ncbi:hypothetical protein D9758_011009 [Tetrapyrgos nigripes]|uniref:Nephrocystin 3-like N-terminal domain-containing protein n=1 Tax=Tetrapyrgos nigripes TaxID=182062 RepID=A0A8H5LPF9_9AGAR|nr:hypothetical protein D9758_011009 [Tetrapyrgos nigripes]
MKQVRKFLHIDKKQNRNPNQPRKTRLLQLGHHSSNATPRTSTADLDHNEGVSSSNQPSLTVRALLDAQALLIAPVLPTATRASGTPPPIPQVSSMATQPSPTHSDFDTFPTSNSMMSDMNRKGKGDAKGSGTNDYLKYGENIQSVQANSGIGQIIPNAQVMRTGEDIQSAQANRAGQSITSTPVMERGSTRAFINLMGAQQDAGGDINNTINVNLEFEKALAIERDTSKICKNQALQNLPVASAAAYTSGIYGSDVVRRACTKGTRTEVIEDIQCWLQSENAAPVFWLTGAAGMGKTTIAMTICEELEDLFHSSSVTDGSGGQSPVVSFFASRQLDSGKPQYLLPTICRHLANFSSSYAGQLVAALDRDLRLATAKLEKQFEEMLVKPWQASSSERARDLPICIVVVDALDENEKGFLFLKKLLGAVKDSRLDGLRFIVTSRTEPEIAKLCSSFEPNAVCRLQDVPTRKVEEDILLYMEEALPLIEQHTLKDISEHAGGLFIYAATVVKMADPDGRGKTPKSIQERVVQKLLNASGLPQSNSQLEELYTGIIQDALHHCDNDIEQHYLNILHMILGAECPISIQVVSALIKADEETVSFVVDQLHAVMYQAQDGTIHTYHASFADFILCPKDSLASIARSDPRCDVSLVHTSLVQHCYETMKAQLHFNICGLESSFIMDKDIPDLETRVADKIDLTLRYAVIYWTTHLEHSMPSDTLRNIPQSFVNDLLLFWLEAVNLLNARIDAMHGLQLAQNWIDKHVESSIHTWKDAVRFCRSFTSSEMCKSTPHLYVSALSTWDPQSHVSRHWKPRFPNIPEVSATHSSAILMHIVTKSGVQCVAISPNGGQIVSGGFDGSVCVWDAASGEQLKELTGHLGSVWSVAFSPKGDQIVSGGKDSSVHVWDAASGEQLKELTGNSGWVWSVAFSPKGDQIVSGGEDSSVRVWDAASGEQLKELTGHSGEVWSVAFSPKGDQIVSGGKDSSVRVWDAASGEQLKELTGHSGWVQSVAFSPKGDQIVSGGEDSSVHVWDAASGEQLRELTEHSGRVQSVAFSPKGDQIVSGGFDSSVHVWDAASGEQLKELTGHSGWVWSVAFSPKGDQIVSGGDDSSVCVWDAASGEQLKELTGHSGWVWSVAFSPKGDQIVSGGSDSSVCVWDAASGEQLKELTRHSGQVLSVAFSPKGDQIVSGGEDSSVHVWDAASGEQLKELTGHSGSVWSVAFSPKGDQIVSGGSDSSVRVWDAASGEQLKELTGHSRSVWSVAFSPKGDQIVSGGSDSSVRVWDAASGEQLKKLTGHSGWVWSVAFSPKGDQIVSGGSDSSVHVWDAASGEQLKELTGHLGQVLSVAFSPKGDQIVSGGEDSSVRAWDAASGEQLKELTGHSGSVWFVAFSPKGDQIVSGGKDSSVRVWDAASGEQLKELTGHSGEVWSVAFSPKGDQIVSGGDNSFVRVWDAANGELTGHSDLVQSLELLPKWNDMFTDTSDNLLWHLHSSGWLTLTGTSYHLISLPTHLRKALYTPYTKLIISKHHPTQLSFKWNYLGRGWTDCYSPSCV